MKSSATMKTLAVIMITALLSVGSMDAQRDNQTPMVQSYAVIDLNPMSGYQSAANGINNNGAVVGYFYDSSWAKHAFQYYNNQIYDIRSVTTGIYFNQANGINNSGAIVGSGTVPSDNNLQHALRYSNGTLQNLTPGLSYHCAATGLNNMGQVVGYCQPQVYQEIRSSPNDTTFNPSQDAFLITGEVMQDLGAMGDSHASSQAYGVNDNGQVVGESQGHAFSYSGNGPMVDLDSALGGNGYSVGYGINNNGQMVGVAYNAFIYDTTSSQMTDLGALGDPNNSSTGLGINNNGVAVGYVNIDSIGDTHAFVYFAGGAMQDLNDMIDPDSDWDLQYATAINDAGQIVGYGTSPSGDEHAFLLDPYLNLIYTGFHQGDTVASGTEFGNADSIKYATPGTEHNYGPDGRAITVRYGCALCSLASMLTSVSGFESMTPVQLDTNLKDTKVNGYVKGCNMYWPAIEKVTGNVLKRVDSSAMNASSTDHSALDEYLDDHCWGNRYRVILQLEANGDRSETHYIFVVGKTSNDWTVFDPGWSSASDLDGTPDSLALGSLYKHFAGFKTANGLSWVFTVIGVETYQIKAPASGDFNEVAQSPVELLVTDPNGNRVGYDPVAGADIFEILGASYTRDYPILDAVTDSGGAGDTSGIKTVSIPSPVGGSYRTTMTGTASGSYTLDSSIIWPGNSEIDQTVTSTTDIGVTTTNTSFVIVPPVITSSSIVGGTFSLSFTSQTNVTYIIEGIDSLADMNWSALQTLTTTDTNTTANVPVSSSIIFLRVRSQ